MIKGGSGGSKTLTGLKFEKKVDLYLLLSKIPEYKIKKSKTRAGVDVLYKNMLVARCFRKHDFYKFFEENNVDWRKIISRKLLPDNAMLVILRNTLFIIEAKYQQVTGSVDEKLQTCDFKRKQYLKLITPLGLKVEYIYVLSNWFKKPEYRDVLDYIQSVNCHYKFNELPLSWLGLPG
jgi:hypothetical protein